MDFQFEGFRNTFFINNLVIHIRPHKSRFVDFFLIIIIQLHVIFNLS